MELAALISQTLPGLAGHGADSITSEQLTQMQVDNYNRTSGVLTGVDCPECQNRGYIAVVGGDGFLKLRECRCCAQRKALERARKSGLGDLLEKRVKDFNCALPHQKILRDAAISYLREGEKHWFTVLGQTGAGKTHICAAVVNELLRRGWDARYMLWTNEVRELKRVATDDEAYSRKMNPLLETRLLYIDDLFKGKITEADQTIAFEILNTRTIRGLRTVISSELLPDELTEIDPALYGRIRQMSGPYLTTISRDESKNYRMRDWV